MQAVPGDCLDIDRKERVNKPFVDLILRDPEKRTRDFDDVVIEFTPEMAMAQAARCIHCPAQQSDSSIKRHRKDCEAVVVDVLTDQVYATWRRHDVGRLRGCVSVRKELYQLFHLQFASVLHLHDRRRELLQ